MINDDAVDVAPILSNSDRLKKHLKDDSLAAHLVQTYQDANGSVKSLKSVLTERLDQARKEFGADEN